MIEDDVRSEGKRLRHYFVQSAEILSVFYFIRQGHVDPALLFSEGKIILAMDGERKNIGIKVEDICCSISLVDIQINDRGPAHPAIFPERMNCHGNVIEDAEPRSFRAEGMVRS